ncbi:MAG: hypothetical protein ABIA21_03455 [Candidatus Aenigmatarchaeota archaeon]
MAIESMRQAWNTYVENFWTFVGAFLIYLVIILAFVIPIGMIFGIYIINAWPASPGYTALGLITNPIFAVGFIITFVIMGIVAIEIYAGMIGLSRNSLDRRSDFTVISRTIKKNFLSILGLNLAVTVLLFAIFGVFSIASFFLYIFAGIITGIILFSIGIIVTVMIGLLFMLGTHALVCSNIPVLDSIKISINIVKRNYIDFLALTLFFFVAAFLISFLPIIGFLMVWFMIFPLFILSCTTFYINKKSEIKVDLRKQEKESAKLKIHRRIRYPEPKRKRARKKRRRR